MQTKTYFASSVPAAIEAARKELGEDAMLVTSKPSSAEARPLGRLEVTFAYEARPRNGSLKSELDEIRGQISALKQAVVRPALKVMDAAPSPVVEQLCASGLGHDLAEEVAAALKGNEAPDALTRELAARIPVAPFPEPKSGETRTIALVGPPGRGKTTTLVKIALRFGLAKRIPVKIYIAGSHGVGCEDQMARYASILGVPFQSCESLESLGLALNGEMWKGLVLIDTPGISPADVLEIGEFARFFKRRPEIEKHLVLRSDARSADITNVIARFSSMEVSRLLFTGLDEALSLGSMADAIIRSRIPAALAGTGQKIPEDLETVSAVRLARALHGENASVAAAA